MTAPMYPLNALRALFAAPPPDTEVLLIDIETREVQLVAARTSRTGRVVRYPDGAALSPQWWTWRGRPGHRLALLRAHDWRPLGVDGEALRAIPYSAEEFHAALESEIPLEVLARPPFDWKVLAMVLLGLVALVAAVT